MRTPSGHTRLLSASRLTVAPNHCMHSLQSGQKSATLLRSSSGSAGAGRQAVLTAVICFGLCASEEWGFAYMLRSGSKLVSACNLTLPLVAACSCACVLVRAFPAASQDYAIEYEGYERPALAKRTADHAIYDNTAKAHIGAESSSTRSSTAKRALQQAKALRRSDTTHFR